MPRENSRLYQTLTPFYVHKHSQKVTFYIDKGNDTEVFRENSLFYQTLTPFYVNKQSQKVW